MNRLTAVLSAGLLFIGISLAMAQDKPLADETKGQAQIDKKSVSQSEGRKKDLEKLKEESNERTNMIKKKLPRTINQIKDWIKENKFPPYQSEIFSDLARIDNDQRVFDIYCEIIENTSDIRAKLSAIAGMKHINNKTAIPTLGKALSDKSIFVRCAAADTLFSWGEKDIVYPIYIEIMNREDLENQLDKEIPEKLKQIGFGADKSNSDWELYSYRVKIGIIAPMLENILTYDKSEVKKLITGIVKKKKTVSLIEKYIELDSERLEQQKKKYPDWEGYKLQEDYLKTMKNLIEKINKIESEVKIK